MAALKRLGQNKCFGGLVSKWQHNSQVLGLPAKFSVFLPEKASDDNRVHALYWLSGLTCTEDNFIQKAGAQQHANAHNVALICPDTSPRGANVEGEDDSYDLGTGAGFYIDATTEKWKKHYRMYSYVTKELPELIEANFPVTAKKSVFGHSMGGHGALSLYLKNPGMYESVSAFSPITNPVNCPWGENIFKNYLGEDDKKSWKDHDSTELINRYEGPNIDIFIDQGSDDEFLKSGQLLPENFKAACDAKAGSVSLRLEYREGYDHSYFFISTFIGEHVKYHADILKKTSS